MGDTSISSFVEFEEAIARSANPTKGFVSKYQYVVSAKALKELKYFNKLGNNRDPKTNDVVFKTVAGRMRFYHNLISLLSYNADVSGCSSAGLVITQAIHRISEHHAVVLHDILVNPGLAEAQMTLLNVTDEVKGFSYIHRAHTKSRPGKNFHREFEKSYKCRDLKKDSLLHHVLCAEVAELLNTARLLSEIFSINYLTRSDHD